MQKNQSTQNWVNQITNPPKDRPLLVYDGDCSFCRRWVVRIQTWAGEAMTYTPYQQAVEQGSDIPASQFAQSVHYIATDGTVYYGAEAIFLALKHAPGFRFYYTLYKWLPGFSLLSEWGYRLVADNRPAFDKLMTWMVGRDDAPASFLITRDIFLRGLGLIYLMAFISLWVQVDGLIGEDGILPAADYLQQAHEQIGSEAFFYIPSLLWFSDSDTFLNALCIAGIVASIILIMGFMPLLMLLALFTFYLSLTVAGQEFLQYQWDTLLLETGFLALLLAPWTLWLNPVKNPAPARFLLYFLWLLLFKLMFSSGMVKLLSGDPAWRNLTALEYHFETQPITNWVAWYFHNLPGSVLWFSCLMMLIIEIAIPFLIFTPRKPRQWAAGILIALQVLIILTGNYGFFNYLTIVLCLTLFDDTFWQRLFPKRILQSIPKPLNQKCESTLKGYTAMVVGIPLVCLSIITILTMFMPGLREVQSIQTVRQWTQPFNINNNYGLFAVMTTTRPEIILQGSNDGETWRDYDFRWKVDAPDESPRFVAPHMPRVSWQMWFAALGDVRRNRWFIRLQEEILLGNNLIVEEFFNENPFPDSPPKYTRALVYDYQFTNWHERSESGNWWKSRQTGTYNPVLSLKQAQ